MAVPTDSEHLSYEIHGSTGPLLLLLHGLGSRGEDWVFQIEALRDEYRVLAPDLRGHGDSPAASGWPTIGDMAVDVAELLEALGEHRAHVVGLSLGGGVALQLGLDYPQWVESLTIVNAAATLRVPRHRWPHAIVRVFLLLTGQRQRLGEWVAAGLFPRPEHRELRKEAAKRISSNLRRNYLRAIIAILRFNIADEVHRIQAPTLVVAGELDDTVPLGPKRDLARGISHASLEVIAGSGHATPLDAPDQFNSLLKSFLREQARAYATASS